MSTTMVKKDRISKPDYNIDNLYIKNTKLKYSELIISNLTYNISFSLVLIILFE